jgi:hypothetical protein
MERIDGVARAGGMMNAAPRRLPIETVVKRSFLYAWESRATLMTPFLIYVAVTILVDIVLNGLVGSAGRPVQFLLAAAEQVFSIGFAVGIHRYVLAGEIRSGFQFFRWDRHFVRYILLSLLLLLLVVVAAAMVLGGVGFDPATQTIKVDQATALVGSATLFVVSIVVSRLSLLLPAAALGDEVRARAIWQASEGNGFRLMATSLLVLLPFMIVEMILIGLESGGVPTIVVAILLALVTSALWIVLNIALSLSYDVLVRGGGPPPR